VSLAIAATVCLSAASRADTGEEWASDWTGTDLPEGSPFWWTVSGQVGPRELKATLTDPEANEARYREAVRAGFDRSYPRVKDFEWVVYVHGSQTPDLIPLWAAYQMLRGRVRPGPYFWDLDRPSRELRSRLRGAGLSNEGAEAVVAQVEEVNQVTEALNHEAQPLRERFSQVRRRAGWFLGESGVQRAIDLGNDALIARASFTGAEEVGRLREVCETNYTDQVWLQATETLKVRLAAEDWEHFREFLRGQVVPSFVYHDFTGWPVAEAQPIALLIRVLIALGLLLGMPVMLVYLTIRRMRGASD